MQERRHGSRSSSATCICILPARASQASNDYSVFCYASNLGEQFLFFLLIMLTMRTIVFSVDHAYYAYNCFFSGFIGGSW